MKRAARLALVCALAATLAPARAQDDAGDRLDALRAERDAAEARAEQYSQAAALIEDRSMRAAAEARALNAEIAAARAAMAESRAREVRMREEATLARDDLARAQAPLSRMVAALQRFARRPMLLSLLQPASIRDQMRRQALFSALEPTIARRTAALRDDLARLEQLETGAATARQEQEAARERLAARQAELAALSQSDQELAQSLSEAAGLANRQAALRTAEVRTIAALAADSGRRAALSRELAAFTPPMARQTSAGAVSRKNRLPVAGRIVSGFGEKDASGLRSTGLTIEVAARSPVTAPGAGTVLFADRWPGYGTVVVVWQDDGALALVAGLAEAAVRRERRVAAGARLGIAPSSDPMIFYELRRDGSPVHPLL